MGTVHRLWDWLRRPTVALALSAAVALAGCAKRGSDAEATKAQPDMTKKAAALKESGISKQWTEGKGAGSKAAPKYQ